MNKTKLAVHYKLSPTLVELLLLLVEKEYVTTEDITTKLQVKTAPRVLVARLREALEDHGIKVWSKRIVGYWLDEEARSKFVGVEH